MGITLGHEKSPTAAIRRRSQWFRLVLRETSADNGLRPNRRHPFRFGCRRPSGLASVPLLSLMLVAFALAGRLPGEELTAVSYHGIRPTDPGGRVGLRNPERGWRIETVIAEPGQKVFVGPAAHLLGKVPPLYQEDWWLMDARRFEPFGLTLVQAYCYLSDYPDKPIPPEKLALLQRSLDNLRRHGLTAVLRFAYEKDMNVACGPKPEWILRHVDQLGPILRKNTDVIYVLQAGFIGAWGEWHSATHIGQDDYVSRAAIVKRLLEVLPEDRILQVRVPKYKRLALSEPILNAFEMVSEKTAHTKIPAARIGFHNDGFLAGPSDGGTWPETPRFGNPGNPEFDYMTRESPFVPVDGELFWADQGFDGKTARGKGVDGLNAALRMRLHHYSSFSLAHSYSEREGQIYSIDHWLATPITVEELRKAGMPVADGYFEDGFGNPVSRSQFEYIQDHLGYRLELKTARFPGRLKSSGEIAVEIELINLGFSTLHNPRPVYLTLTDPEGSVTELRVHDSDPRRWQPFQPGDETYRSLLHKISFAGQLPVTVKLGWYQIGLWMPDAQPTLRLDSRYAVRVANRDVPWWTDSDGRYGINVLGTLEILP